MALISGFHLLIILTALITTDVTLGAAANSLSTPQCHLSGMDPLGGKSNVGRGFPFALILQQPRSTYL